jgi:Rrf2 family protein
MFELALWYDQKLVQIKDIAKNQNLPEKYLEQIMILLKNAGLVKSVRGAQGGYYLSKSPGETTVKEIIEALEGSLYPVECAEHPETCPNAPTCPTVGVWGKVGEQIRSLLGGMTLEQLVEDYKKHKQDNMFYI